MGELRGKIVVRNRKAYFAYSETASMTPELCTSFWRLPDAFRDFEGNACIWSNTGGPHYTVLDDRGLALRTIPDMRRGQAPPDETERTPIPPPKTRLETRWHNGRWERRYAKGWR